MCVIFNILKFGFLYPPVSSPLYPPKRQTPCLPLLILNDAAAPSLLLPYNIQCSSLSSSCASSSIFSVFCWKIFTKDSIHESVCVRIVLELVFVFIFVFCLFIFTLSCLQFICMFILLPLLFLAHRSLHPYEC